MNKPKETCCDGRLPFTNEPNRLNKYWLEDAMRNENSYIHEHLMTLYFIAREFNCKNIVEIGTGNGDSTLALGYAARDNDGAVISIDINQCLEAKERIRKADLDGKVACLQVKPDYDFDMKFDLLLIDGDHSKDGVKEDIIRFLNQELNDGCFVIFHDTNNPKWKDDIAQAITECDLLSRKYGKNRKQYFRSYHWFNCNGLLVLRYEKREEID